MLKPLTIININENDDLNHWIRPGLEYDLVFLNYSTDEVFLRYLDKIDKQMSKRADMRFMMFDYTNINRGKWRNIKWFIEHNERRMRHKFYWFPDPDLIIEKVSTVNSFLRFTMKSNIALCQPALTCDSKCSHPRLKQIPGLEYRETDFVEVMCPCFNRDTLKQVLWTFDESYSGYGIDLLWKKFVTGEKYIIDKYPVCHPRKPNFAERAKKRGWPNPDDELAGIKRKYDL